MPEDNGTVVNNNAVEDAATAEATTAETQKSTENELFEKMFGGDADTEVDSEAKQDAGKTTESAASNDDDKPDSKQKGAEARKEQLSQQTTEANEEIRQMVAEKNRILAERQQLAQELAEMRANAQQQELAQQIPTVEEIMGQENPYTNDFYTEFEANAIIENFQLRQQIEQAEQQKRVDEENARIAQSTNLLADEATRALKDFPIFDEESPEYDETLALQADAIVQPMLIRDGDGNPIGSNIPVYDLYKTLYDATKKSSATQQQRVDASKYKNLASVDTIRGAGSEMHDSNKDETKEFVKNFFNN